MASRTDIPVAVGASDPLGGTFAGGTVAVHGADGVGGVRDRLLPAVLPEAAGAAGSDTDAADLLLSLSHEYAGELHLIAIGPLTNLAIALERDPSLVKRVAGLAVMGGANGGLAFVAYFVQLRIAPKPRMHLSTHAFF